MKVEAVLARKGRHVETVRPDADLAFAVHRLTTHNIGALVVTGDGKRVNGVLSERDVVRALARHGPQVLERGVAAVMSKTVPVCSPEDSLTSVMSRMTETRNRHLPVADESGLCGIISIGDVVKHRLEELEMQANVLRDAYLTRG